MELRTLAEPLLTFGHGQQLEDPRDGLTLFGPLESGTPYGLRVGVVGTADGSALYRQWVRRLARPFILQNRMTARPYFPGFEATFGVPWAPDPLISAELNGSDIERATRISDRYQRVDRVVDLFAEPIERASHEREERVDLWFVVIPDYVHKYCRPQSTVERSEQIAPPYEMTARRAATLRGQKSLFDKDNIEAELYQRQPDFHHQLKARLLQLAVPTQVVRESVLESGGADQEFASIDQLAIAWNLASATYYKSGRRPWKSAGVREGVCYVGLVFKDDPSYTDGSHACCAAQMFIDSGDGYVFRSTDTALRSSRRGDFHLSKDSARQLLGSAIETFRRERGMVPGEVFVHGRVRFNDDEWQGFREAADVGGTDVVGVRIQEAHDLKAFRRDEYAVLRGSSLVLDARTAFLWTKGYVPRLDTYPGREVPNPLTIEVSRGAAPIELVLSDVLALTKLNYNACVHSDGMPVTLKFANAVGEVLTAARVDREPPLPFKYYI